MNEQSIYQKEHSDVTCVIVLHGHSVLVVESYLAHGFALAVLAARDVMYPEDVDRAIV
jgi:hypothetical protein